ncbi:recombinase family protein [Cryobacterium sp. 1639]|uniref:recombinase family protein n=1 Tax=Cryobacterium inferilacus TaxID=2866629 RepID=UPI001C72CDA0|nr:recombinase family protein [Cryobacterium sp. 1639]MBX0301889.1 recombinase family protein [Cryobacterium sp. 1639]
MTVIGYARVGTRKLSVDEREIALTAAGAERLYVDHGESRNKASLPQFSACLDYLRAGDLLLVCQLSQLDRLGRDDRLIALLHEFGERGIGLRSLAEPAIDTTGPAGRTLYDIIDVFAQLRADAIQVHRREGPAPARAHGTKGGRPTAMTAERVVIAIDMRENGATIDTIATTLGVDTVTVQRALLSNPDGKPKLGRDEG